MLRKSKELIRNAMIIFLGKFSTQFLSFFLLPLYTSMLLSEEYGVYDLIITYIALFVPVISLQIEMAIFRELIDARQDNKKSSQIISSGIYSVLIQFMFCIVIYYIISIIIEIPYKNYIILNIFVVMISNIFMQITRGKGKNVDYSVASVIAGVTNIFFNILFLVVFKFKVEGLLISSILSNILATIYIIVKCSIYEEIRYSSVNREIIKKLLKYSFPLVPNGLIWWVINVSDRTIISIFLGTSANGIYAVANKFSSILIQFFNVFNLSWTESATLHINETDKNDFFSNVFSKVIKYSLTVCLLIIAALPFSFGILVGTDYSEAYLYIPILLIGMIFNIIVSFIGSIYIAKKMTSEVAKTSFFAGVLNILINVLLIKIIGIYAATLSTLISFFIMSIFRLIDVQKYVKLSINIKENILILLLFTLSIFIYYYKNILISQLYFAFVFIFVLIDNFKYIKNLI